VSQQERYEQNLESLLERGKAMLEAVSAATVEGEFGSSLKYTPRFHDGYQAWYSESRALVKQILPDSLDDFVRHYSSTNPKEYSLISNLLQGNHGMGVEVPIGRLGTTEEEVPAAGRRCSDDRSTSARRTQ